MPLIKTPRQYARRDGEHSAVVYMNRKKMDIITPDMEFQSNQFRGGASG
jgi:hypothetical protein